MPETDIRDRLPVDMPQRFSKTFWRITWEFACESGTDTTVVENVTDMCQQMLARRPNRFKDATVEVGRTEGSTLVSMRCSLFVAAPSQWTMNMWAKEADRYARGRINIFVPGAEIETTTEKLPNRRGGSHG